MEHIKGIVPRLLQFLQLDDSQSLRSETTGVLSIIALKNAAALIKHDAVNGVEPFRRRSISDLKCVE